MNYRDWLQQVIYKIINPVVHGMIRIGITPNFITTTGLVLNIVAAALKKIQTEWRHDTPLPFDFN